MYIINTQQYVIFMLRHGHVCYSLLLRRNDVSEWNFMRPYNTFSNLKIYLKLSHFSVNIWNRDVIIRGFHLDVVTSRAWFIPEWRRSSDCLPKWSQPCGLPYWKQQCLSLCEIQISCQMLSDLALSKTQDNVRQTMLILYNHKNHDLFTLMYSS